MTHDLGWWLVGKRMIDFLFAVIELLSLSITVPFRSYEAKCVQLSGFCRGSTSLHSYFTWTGSSPSTILGTGKLETLVYPTMKTVPLCVLSFKRFDTIPRCDGQTDGQTNRHTNERTDGFVVAYTALVRLCFEKRCEYRDL